MKSGLKGAKVVEFRHRSTLGNHAVRQRLYVPVSIHGRRFALRPFAKLPEGSVDHSLSYRRW